MRGNVALTAHVGGDTIYKLPVRVRMTGRFGLGNDVLEKVTRAKRGQGQLIVGLDK